MYNSKNCSKRPTASELLSHSWNAQSESAVLSRRRVQLWSQPLKLFVRSAAGEPESCASSASAASASGTQSLPASPDLEAADRNEPQNGGRKGSVPASTSATFTLLWFYSLTSFSPIHFMLSNQVISLYHIPKESLYSFNIFSFRRTMMWFPLTILEYFNFRFLVITIL